MLTVLSRRMGLTLSMLKYPLKRAGAVLSREEIGNLE
jgi:hypothetical protein